VDAEATANRAGTCELIAISAGRGSNGRAFKGRLAWIEDRELHSRAASKYFNVLWIEWEEGVAYRMGVGKVLKDMWGKQEREWVMLFWGETWK